MSPSPGSYAVLYDRDCGFCRWSLDKILAWDRRRRLRPVAIQSEEGHRLLAPVPPERRLDSWHLPVGGDGRSAGAAARPRVPPLPGGRPPGAALRAFPRAPARAYRWVADHRGLMAGLLRVDDGCELRR